MGSREMASALRQRLCSCRDGAGVLEGMGSLGQGQKAVSHLGEDVGCVGGGRGQGGEEGGLARRLDGVDHPQLRVLQVGGLPVGVDEHEHIIHTYGREPRAGRGRLRPKLGLDQP